MARATGLAESTIRLGQRALQPVLLVPAEPGSQWVRRSGGGRKRLTEHDPSVRAALEALVEPTTRGDPMSPLRWTCNSTHKLAVELTGQGHLVNHRNVAQLPDALGDSLQGTRKTREGSAHADRNAQFTYLNEQVTTFQHRGQPVVSVDTTKKELVGDVANAGREYQPHGKPERVHVHDVEDKELGNAIPYGLYDLTANRGWVSVGTDHDTAAFAVATLRRWWWQMGCHTYPPRGNS